MKLITRLTMITALGTLLVTLLSVAFSVIGGVAPARPAIYFIVLTLAFIPLLLVIIGALAARAAYFACRGPNESIAASAAVALLSAVVGIALWLVAVAVAGLPDFVGPLLEYPGLIGYLELVPLMLVYTLAGSIGGVIEFFIAQGRKCDVMPNGSM